MQAEKIGVADVWVGDRLRPVVTERVQDLARSIQELGGLRTPITVRIIPEMVNSDGVVTECVPALVAGRHRLEAAKLLGWEEIDAFVIDGDERDARLWEIAENLHRAELTALERSEHVAEWIRLTEEKARVQSAQVGPIESKRQDGRGHRKESGINAASRDIGVTRQEAQRAAKVDALSDTAKAVAREVGLDDNQSALLAAAAEKDAEAQADKLREIKRRKEEREIIRKAGDAIVSHDANDEAAAIILEHVPHDARQLLVGHFGTLGLTKLVKAVRRAERDLAGPSDRDTPIFDRTAAGNA